MNLSNESRSNVKREFPEENVEKKEDENLLKDILENDASREIRLPGCCMNGEFEQRERERLLSEKFICHFYV